MIRKALILAVLLPLGLSLFACASREALQAERVAKQTVADTEDDAKCRAANAEPGSPEYDACREQQAAQRAQQADIEYQKARDFDRVLGGLDDL